MKIAILQSGIGGFFPKYFNSLSNSIKRNGDDVYLLVPNSGRNKMFRLYNQIRFGCRLNWHIHTMLYKITGLQDIFSIFDTLCLLHILKKISPDIIHFNVVNDKVINMPLLVYYINRHKIPIVWTMHDCRAFTGLCPYFDEVNCFRWKKGCGQCPLRETIIDATSLVWKIRKEIALKIDNLTIITPSKWLASFVKESFFSNSKLQVIYNGVDINAFSTPTKINVYDTYGIKHDKKIVLGCAIFWENRKGLMYFECLEQILPKNYQIILVGNIEDNMKHRLIAKNIICTGRTKNLEEMVALYQHASVFCNPTMADNFPTTNIEALASGTPIVTFNTGGSPEAIDENTGIVVEKGNLKELCSSIIKIVENKDKYSYDNCVKRSKLFSCKQYDKYIELYHKC